MLIFGLVAANRIAGSKYSLVQTRTNTFFRKYSVESLSLGTLWNFYTNAGIVYPQHAVSDYSLVT